jgi:hypothetical protein
MNEMLWRFILGGIVVSAFAMLGDLLKPKSFAGLFSAAPSVALATICLAIAQHGRAYASDEARSMVLGALAFSLYAIVVARLLLHFKLKVLPVTTGGLALWMASAFGLWFGLLR